MRSFVRGGILLAISAACLPPAAAFDGLLNLPAQFESRRATYRGAIGREAETEVARMDGAGCLRHFWLTIGGVREKPENGLKLTLRIYFDGSPTPAVETPVAPFFGIHHGHAAKYLHSPFLQVTERAGFNSYFPMPYARGMRMTLQNDSTDALSIWLQADFRSYRADSMREPLRFHAAYRRVNPAEAYGKPFHFGHGTGQGFIAGVSLGIRVLDRRDAWYHCGGDLVLLDGRRRNAHLLHGIGGEDFFGTAWGQEVFSNGSVGTPYYDEAPQAKEEEPRLWFAAYRLFDRDPIVFQDSYSFDFGTLANDMSGVLYWYQKGTAPRSVRLPALEDRLASARVPDGKYDVDPPAGRSWKLCGPFPSGSEAEFDRSEFPEKGVVESETRPAGFGQYAEAAKRGFAAPRMSRWTGPVASIFNFVDLTPHYRSGMKTNAGFPVDTSAYAYTVVASSAAAAKVLRLGHDDWIRVWHNGKVIYDGAEKSGFQTVEIPVRLARGENRFLVKAANRENTNFRAWVFLFDLLDAAAPGGHTGTAP